MGKKPDIETTLFDVVEILQRDLNAKIQSINNEKNDEITLAPIDDGAYSMLGLEAKVLNRSSIVIVDLDDVESVGTGAAIAEQPTIRITLLVQDSGQDKELTRKMLRYMRALKEVFEAVFTKNRYGPILELTSLAPARARVPGSSANYMATGVNLKTSLP